VVKRILLKLGHPSGGAEALRGITTGATVRLERLFDARTPQVATPGAAPIQHTWFVAEASSSSEFATRGRHPWDVAHEMSRCNLGIAGAQVIAAEPDFEQEWPVIARRPEPSFAPSGLRQRDPNDQKGAPYIAGPGFAWHLGDGFTGLRKARDSLKTDQSDVTIVHLDTGYDRTHRASPERVAAKLERNFVDPGRLNQADDETPMGEVLTNRGHGTGTLGILAGRKLADVRPEGLNGITLGGAAPMRIVPVRIANSVVHFWTSTVAQGIDYARRIGADVVSMSMGGLPSAAWTDVVNAAYEEGIVVVCAAGNNFGGLPTSLIVYPARFRRVIAACGAMADGTPYFHMPIDKMGGNVGPSTKMRTAITAFTPNIPWARIGSSDIVDLDGGGTSAATPQVAAAAALWLHRNGAAFSKGSWQRAEAARQALFRTAKPRKPDNVGPDPMFGRGQLRAAAALELTELDGLQQEPPDNASFAFLHLLTSAFGVAPGARNTDMLALELTQLAQSSRAAQEVIVDPDLAVEAIPEVRQRRFLEVILSERHGSQTLNQFLTERLGRSRVTPSRTSEAAPSMATAVPPPVALGATESRRILTPPPPNRRLQIFATDPGFGRRLATAFLNVAIAEVPWETRPDGETLLQPGPVGEYVEVVDVDPASGVAYEPVDLNHPFLLAQDGLPPSEGNPQFHQQISYAVAMQTIRHFEVALGRRVLWAPRRIQYAPSVVLDSPALDKSPSTTPLPAREAFVRRLRIYPHALRQANAYYSPQKVALMLGYFPAADGSRRLVFTCLSHDIIAHETTHALLDGLHRRFQEATNPDVLAFHEAFADIVAIFQHFTFPELLRFEIGRKRGDLAQADLLAGLAQEFGQTLGRSGALRSAIGKSPSPGDYAASAEPHERGKVLVAAVFSAFLAIYLRRIEDLVRIASDGSGILRAGALHPDLVARLADEATRAARHVLTICIRALDYMPPVDPTFPEYLRALITADSDLVPNDHYGYRVAFLESFGGRGIFPPELHTLSVESLRWQTLDSAAQPYGLGDFIRKEIDLSWDLRGDRYDSYCAARGNAARLHGWLKEKLEPVLAHALGLDRAIAAAGKPDEFQGLRDDTGRPRFEVHSVRPARRSSPDGDIRTDIIAVVTQQRNVRDKNGGTFRFRGGCTLVLDRREGMPPIRYSITKPVYRDPKQVLDYSQFRLGRSLSVLYFGDAQVEPFAVLHSEI
jgi:subtilisin family serine protease